MSIAIKQMTDIDMVEILPLYADAGWVNYTQKPDMLENAYRNSLAILGAYDGETLAGVIRAVGDGHSILYVQDIIVLSAYQRKGVGTMLLKTLLAQYVHVYQKVLLTDNQPKTVAFYKSLGFRAATECGCAAFVRQSV